jgi:hypothetical protein
VESCDTLSFSCVFVAIVTVLRASCAVKVE